jgi:hypothetical protein
MAPHSLAGAPQTAWKKKPATQVGMTVTKTITIKDQAATDQEPGWK